MSEDIIRVFHSDEIKVENSKKIFMLHVELSAATGIAFWVTYTSEQYDQTLIDIGRVAGHMLRLDGDIAEMYDDAGRTQPKTGDKLAVKDFLTKYRGRIPDDLPTSFDMHWADQPE